MGYPGPEQFCQIILKEMVATFTRFIKYIVTP